MSRAKKTLGRKLIKTQLSNTTNPNKKEKIWTMIK
jgi:hypothetical protein